MRLVALSLFTFLAFLPAASAQDARIADDGGYSRLKPLDAAAMDDDTPIRMTPDGPAVIQLDRDAGSVIIGNPAQASAVLENPRTIMLVPQQPGATKIIVLDRDGKTLLNRHVLVGGGRSGFIRINKPCGATTQNETCHPVAMYYCPDRCYETSVPQPGSDVAAPATAPAPPPSSAASGGSDGGDAPAVPESVGENPIEINGGAQ
ncbi:MAG: pilus assembly protein N-terminal domain-containing protein [Rhodospirillales bacterium]|nr:pilus assembly protein N-terminal domain-containing protein [Alphaproteobacteria bacterium]MCB9986190.1 pilus assembly protein N-terminal domain-containing protein [Rhodospirillales bacterium]USO07253.1 MAG: pilus assembly protein N-terminal domain-containing protein [Rhodospirillales bacterium]